MMKRSWFLFLALVLGLTFVGCNDGKGDDGNDSPTGITSSSELEEYLKSQPENSADNPIEVKVNINVGSQREWKSLVQAVSASYRYVAFGYTAELSWGFLTGGDMRLQILNSDKSAVLSRKDFNTGISWTQASHSVTVDISSLKSPTCEFILRWNTTGSRDYQLGTRTITVTAVK